GNHTKPCVFQALGQTTAATKEVYRDKWLAIFHPLSFCSTHVSLQHVIVMLILPEIQPMPIIILRTKGGTKGNKGAKGASNPHAVKSPTRHSRFGDVALRRASTSATAPDLLN
ncbi:MAG: hypothetical protein SVT52_03895, partial [Planctomycetota bacterium]|nr:hypothetical protein [Planctomycetota bacterium]